MSSFYIMLPDDIEENLMYDSNILGETSFGSFWPNQGFGALMNISEKHPELLPNIKILDDQKNQYTLETFLAFLDGFKIRRR